MILHTQFQFFSGGNTPGSLNVGRGDGSVHPWRRPPLAFFWLRVCVHTSRNVTGY